ncbi:winged helix-turn-helix transcriptional regulator [Candidatus Pacearchaeota archaeon]|nr:winged helix-turn-helix transcriptional regulator [Candidatus Pacearchaeota archaeon]
MVEKYTSKRESLLKRIKEIGNKSKFMVLELTQNNEFSIKDLSKKVGLAYNKCSNYCSRLENLGLILKRKEGKEVFIKSKTKLRESSVIFN